MLRPMHASRQGAVIDVVEARRIEEARPELRLELIDGALYSMGWASPWHAAMVMAVGGEIRNQLRGSPCRAYNETLAVGTRADDPSYVHPDVSIICGPSVRHPSEPTVVLNAKVIVEILSPGTFRRDQTDRLDKCKSAPTVEAIVHVDHRRRCFKAWFRVEAGWLEVERTTGTLELPAIGVTLDVDALYDEAAAEDGGPDA